MTGRKSDRFANVNNSGSDMPGIPNYRVADASDAEEIERGAYVRSYDFEDRADCYVEGTVVHTDRSLGGCYRYEIDPVRRVWGGKEVPIPDDEKPVFPPRNGTRNLLGGYTNGVRKVGRP